MKILLDISLSPLPGWYDSQVSRFGGGGDRNFPLGNIAFICIIFLNLCPQFSHAFQSQLTPPFSRLPGAVTTHLLSLVAKRGWGRVGARRDSWAPARSSCWVSLLVTEISWEDSLFR